MVHPDDIKLLAQLYIKHTGATRSGLGTNIGVGQKFFFNLFAGKGYHSDSGVKVWIWFQENWPADLPWPWRGTPPLISEAGGPTAHHAAGSCMDSAS